MKNFLPMLAMILLLAACDNTKIQLRAPEPKGTEAKTTSTTDSVKTDSTQVAVKN